MSETRDVSAHDCTPMLINLGDAEAYLRSKASFFPQADAERVMIVELDRLRQRVKDLQAMYARLAKENVRLCNAFAEKTP